MKFVELIFFVLYDLIRYKIYEIYNKLIFYIFPISSTPFKNNTSPLFI